VAVFSRNASTGQLTFVERHVDGMGGVDGLDSARAVAVSPEGRQVYIVSDVDNAVVAYSRSPSSGALTFEELLRDGVSGVDGLGGARSVTFSPGGEHVYAASYLDDAVAVFCRNAPLLPVGSGPVDVLACADLTLADIDDTHLQSATATLTNLLDSPAETLAVDTSGTAIAAGYVAGTGVLSLSGSDTLANYQQVLSTLTYDNTATSPDLTTRTVEVMINDGSLDSGAMAFEVRLQPAP
jgi:hypothetical protein